MSRIVINNNEEKSDCEREVFFDIPVITTSSPSVVNSDSDTSPVYVNISKRSFDRTLQSDEEADTSFINNNNTVNGRVSILRSLSPGNLNASGVSRGVSSFGLVNFSFGSIQLCCIFTKKPNLRMYDDGHNHWQTHPKEDRTEPLTFYLRGFKNVSHNWSIACDLSIWILIAKIFIIGNCLQRCQWTVNCIVLWTVNPNLINLYTKSNNTII